MRITVINAKGYAEADPSSLPKLLTSKRDIVWVDFEGPTPRDIKMMEEVFLFHHLAIEDTTNDKQQPKIEHYPGFTLCILNALTLDGESLTTTEIDIFVGKNYVVTVHPRPAHALEEAYHRVARGGVLAQITPGYLLYMIIDSIIDGYFPVLDAITDRIETLEDITLFKPRKDTLSEIFTYKRILVDMWRIVWPEREMLSVLGHESPHLDMNDLGPYMRDVADHLLWLGDMIQTQRETALGIVDLYMSTVSYQLNRVVNRLTVVTVVIGLMTVIGGFYGMNFAQTWPPFDAPWGVPLVMIMMLVIGVGVWAYFRWQERV